MLAKPEADTKDLNSHMPSTAEVGRHTEQERLAGGEETMRGTWTFSQEWVCRKRPLPMEKEAFKRQSRQLPIRILLMLGSESVSVHRNKQADRFSVMTETQSLTGQADQRKVS